MEGVFSESLSSQTQLHQENPYGKPPSLEDTSDLIAAKANDRIVSTVSLILILGVPLVFGFYIFDNLADSISPSIALAVSWILVLVVFAGIGRWAQNTSSHASRLR